MATLHLLSLFVYAHIFEKDHAHIETSFIQSKKGSTLWFGFCERGGVVFDHPEQQKNNGTLCDVVLHQDQACKQ